MVQLWWGDRKCSKLKVSPQEIEPRQNCDKSKRRNHWTFLLLSGHFHFSYPALLTKMEKVKYLCTGRLSCPIGWCTMYDADKGMEEGTGKLIWSHRIRNEKPGGQQRIWEISKYRKGGWSGTIEPVLDDVWFGRPLVLGDHNHRHGSFLTIKYLAYATTCQTRPATGSFGLTNDSFTCYERLNHADRGNFRQ